MRRLPLYSRASGFGPLFAVVARDFGDDAAEMLRARGHLPSFAEAAMLDPQMPVPFHIMNQVFNDAATRLGDRQLGARIGMAMPGEAFGPYMAYALSAEKLGDIIARILSFSHLQTNALSPSLAVRNGIACWRLTYAVGNNAPLDDHALHAMLPLVSLLRAFGEGESDQIEVHIVDGRAADARALEYVIGGRVRPRSDGYAATFPARWLQRRRPAPAWTEAVGLDVLPYYQQIPLPESVAAAVRIALGRRPLSADVDIESIAAELGRRGRTLQHALAREGVGYRDILRHVRMARAEQLLARTNRPIAEIAQHVGYSDQANFHRAFVAMTGSTPGQFRRDRQRRQSAANLPVPR